MDDPRLYEHKPLDVMQPAMTFDEIADRTNLSRQRVVQLHDLALRKLRAWFKVMAAQTGYDGKAEKWAFDEC